MLSWPIRKANINECFIKIFSINTLYIVHCILHMHANHCVTPNRADAGRPYPFPNSHFSFLISHFSFPTLLHSPVNNPRYRLRCRHHNHFVNINMSRARYCIINGICNIFCQQTFKTFVNFFCFFFIAIKANY